MLILSHINNKRYNRLFKAVIVLSVFISVVFLVVTTIGQGSKKMMSNLNYQKVSLREIIVSPTSQSGHKEIDSDTLQKISRLPHVSSVCAKYQLKFKNSFFLIDSYRVPIGCADGVDTNYDTFSQLHRYLINKKGEKYLVAGSDFSKDSKFEILIDQYIVKKLKYKSDEDIIGKTISIENDITKTVLDFKVVGVFNKYLGIFTSGLVEESEKDLFDSFLIDRKLPFVVPHNAFKDIFTSQSNVNIVQSGIQIGADDVFNVLTIYEGIKKLTNNILFSQVGLASLSTKRFAMIQQVINVFAIVIGTACLLILINSFVIKLEKQKPFTKMLHTLGYNRKKLICLYILDFTRIFVFSLLLYTGISFGLCALIEMTLKDVYTSLIKDVGNLFFLNYKTYLIYTAGFFVIYELIAFILVYMYISKISSGVTYERK